MSEIGAKATADYQGDALGITVTRDGARLRCGFQKLEGRATSEGLWLESTVSGGGEFRLVAREVGREQGSVRRDMRMGAKARSDQAPSGAAGTDGARSWWDMPLLTELEASLLDPPFYKHAAPNGASGCVWEGVRTLACVGTVMVGKELVHFRRPGFTEEYSVSVEGVRQDFVIAEPPRGEGNLRVELALTGARAEAAAYGAKVILEGSGRALAYSRLHATNAAGQELRAQLEVLSAGRLAVQVADADAFYPVRIDPTFSDANWVSLNPSLPGTDAYVRAIAVDSSGNVYIGGDFRVIGTVPAKYIAKWDGSAWSALGAGMDHSVYALAVSGTDLYAGGDFTTAGGVEANRIAKWNGRAWSALGSGIDGRVYALAVSGTNLYVGGWFTKAGGVTANYITEWNGSTWSALGSGMGGSQFGPSRVWALAVRGTDLYAGGDFTTAGGVTANYIAKWDGNTWSALGSGMGGGPFGSSGVWALAVSGMNLYAGGDFTTADGLAANHIAKWDGSAWSTLGSGVADRVSALAVSGTDLYAGLYVRTGGGVAANYIAKWNGSAWSSLGSGTDGIVYVLAASESDLYAGGEFMVAGGVTASHIARWNSSTWSAFGSGSGEMNFNVNAVAVGGTDLYAGGWFSRPGRATLGKWSGTTWLTLPPADGDVYALAVSGTNLYAGGQFRTAGGVTAAYIAKWNGKTWSALGAGMDDVVTALAVSGTDLYAGGFFTRAGEVSANYIAKWDGSAWWSLGSGVDYWVTALAVSGTDLYAGGSFGAAGGVPANYIARWDGSGWWTLGSGMGGSSIYTAVNALTVRESDLYAGGIFTRAGGVAATNIAKWDGNAWSALGSGVSGNADDAGVYALAVSGTDLYAGGYFDTAGGVAANNIAKWNGKAWSALGSGMDGSVLAMATDGSGHLFVGGYFAVAGTTVSPFIAQADLWPPGGVIQDIQVESTSVGLDCAGVPGSAYSVQRATDVRFTENLTTLLTTNAPSDMMFRCTDSAPPSSAAFYRLLQH